VRSSRDPTVRKGKVITDASRCTETHWTRQKKCSHCRSPQFSGPTDPAHPTCGRLSSFWKRWHFTKKPYGGTLRRTVPNHREMTKNSGRFPLHSTLTLLPAHRCTWHRWGLAGLAEPPGRSSSGRARRSGRSEWKPSAVSKTYRGLAWRAQRRDWCEAAHVPAGSSWSTPCSFTRRI
jgi:hypothetical protein